jgi:hypothetical protein
MKDGKREEGKEGRGKMVMSMGRCGQDMAGTRAEDQYRSMLLTLAYVCMHQVVPEQQPVFQAAGASVSRPVRMPDWH